MAAGPLDYTPGAMTNSTAASYRPSNDAPMSLGTRAHQVAMYVVYDGALQMLADSPTAYDREPACADFMAAIPTGSTPPSSSRVLPTKQPCSATASTPQNIPPTTA